MKNQNHDGQSQPTAVTGPQPQQAGDIRDRWSWVEHAVWTERMLTRLERSEPTTQWFRLWDKVLAERNLRHGFYAVWRNQGAPGVDGQSIKQFDEQLERELNQLSQELREKSYQPKPARRVWIDKPGTTEKRPLGIPAVRDRTVQAAVRQVIEPIFERDFAEHSYGFRPGRGCREAVARVEELIKAGGIYCVDVDLKSYFDTIPHLRLMKLVQERIVDGSVLKLIEHYLKAGVMEELKGWQPTERGTPQGSVVSPLLANIYLNPLDHWMVRKGWNMVRYADDFVVLCRTEPEAHEALKTIAAWVSEAGLTLHPTKTRIVNIVTEGFDFLGWHFRGERKYPRQKSRQKLQDKLRPLTRRTNGRSLGEIIAQVNPILRGWGNYFSGSYKTGLSTMDGWLRRRLRALLRQREKRPGYGATKDDQMRWPNRWFAVQGLYSLEMGSCNYG